MSDEICGHTKNDGEPCTFPPKYPDGKCGHHTEAKDRSDDARRSKLESDPDVIDLICDRLGAGDTVAEACAEVPGVSESSYYDWRRKGRKEDSGKYLKFLEETTRARKEAARRDRSELEQALREEGDTRTWYKLHMTQYGDSYGDEDADMREESTSINVPESVANEWQSQR